MPYHRSDNKSLLASRKNNRIAHSPTVPRSNDPIPVPSLNVILTEHEEQQKAYLAESERLKKLIADAELAQMQQTAKTQSEIAEIEKQIDEKLKLMQEVFEKRSTTPRKDSKTSKKKIASSGVTQEPKKISKQPLRWK